MIHVNRKNKEKVLEAIYQGEIYTAHVSYPNLIGAMILKMKQEGNTGMTGDGVFVQTVGQ